jgi:molybdenum-dependent DNA-binding transcriptional regulator ModE
MDKRGASNRKLAGSGSYDAKQSSGSIPEDLQLAE